MDQLWKYYQKGRYGLLTLTSSKEERLKYLLQLIQNSYSKDCINAIGYSYPPNTIWVSINREYKIRSPNELAAEIKAFDPELINTMIESPSRLGVVALPTKECLLCKIHAWWHGP